MSDLAFAQENRAEMSRASAGMSDILPLRYLARLQSARDAARAEGRPHNYNEMSERILRAARDFGDTGINPDFFLRPSGTEMDRGRARKNLVTYLPYLTNAVKERGLRTLQGYDDTETSGINHAQNLSILLNEGLDPSHPKLKSFVRHLKSYARPGNRRNDEDFLTRGEVLDNWANVFDAHSEDVPGYGRIAEELRNREGVLREGVRPNDPLPDQVDGTGMRDKCIDNLSKRKVSKKGLQESYDRGIGAHKTNPSSVRNVQGKKGVGGKKMGKEQWACARAKKLSKLGDKAGYDGDLVKGGGYKITQHTKDQAKKLGVEVKPSQLAKKKIDVFRGGRKVASVGHTDYCDFPTFRECCGTKMANARREAYKTRHEKTRHKKGTPSYYADKLLW